MGLLVLLLGLSAVIQLPTIAYTARQLDCATFRETSDSRILTEAGARTRRQSSTRLGTWRFRATPSDGALALEGWLDALSIRRRSQEAEISPDTDGLLGGRYRGTLSSGGRYTAQAHPFVPDEVAEVAGMAQALDDFFPPLPGRALRQGEAWTDSSGLALRRLPDSMASGARLQRFELRRQEKTRAAPSAADTVLLELQQQTEESGRFVWHPVLGLVRRDRTIVIETTVPPSRSVRQAVRSRVEQRITLARDLRPMRCPAAAGR